jgi:membrane-associated PAP2 superfamily phosphatase
MMPARLRVAPDAACALNRMHAGSDSCIGRRFNRSRRSFRPVSDNALTKLAATHAVPTALSLSAEFPPTLAVAAPTRAVLRPGARLPATALLTPLLLVLALLLVVAAFGLDERLADALYAWQGHRWALRHAWITDTLVHRAGRAISLLAWLATLGTWLASLRVARWRAWRRPLGYLLLSTLLAATLIAWAKARTNMDCPWDLQRYGGDRPFVGLLDARPGALARGHCFPAAHAGTGYAWVALYFFVAQVRPRWRRAALLPGLLAGAVFGLSQQLRGAHFLSHDLSALALCWVVAALLYRAFWPPAERMAGTP